MLKNYLKTLIRHLVRHRFYSALNIAGLTVGLACCMLIGLYISYEFGYDQHFKNRDHIYRVIRHTTTVDHTAFSERTSGGLVEALQQNIYPEIDQALRIHRWQRTVIYGEKKLYKQPYCLADPNILKVFDFPLVQGDPETVFQTPNAAVITQRLAQKLFGDEDPIGKTILIEEPDKDYPHLITGVLKDMPAQTTIQFDILSNMKAGQWQEDWISTNNKSQWAKKWIEWKPEGARPVESYILLKNGRDPKQLEGKFAQLILKHMGEKAALNIRYHLQPLNRIHLYSNQDYGIKAENRGTPETSKPHGDIQNIYLFFLLALFILSIACVNFINLTTARALDRKREVGLRKVVGAERTQLIKQFLGESTTLVMVAVILALGLVELALPSFNAFFESTISLQAHALQLGLGLPLIILVVGIVAGSYPAFFLSAFSPISILKETTSSHGSSKLRNTLVVGQFAIAIILIIATWGVYNQQSFLRNKNLGFDRDLILEVPLFAAANSNQKISAFQFKRQYNTIKKAFTAHPNILHATTSRGLIGQWSTLEKFLPEGKDEHSMEMIGVDEDFLAFYNIDLVSGQNFTQQHAETTNTRRRNEKLSEQFILNETAVKKLGWANPIGKRFTWNYGAFFPNGLRPGTVIGVVKDFHFKPLSEVIKPLVLVTDLRNAEQLYLKVRPENLGQTIAHIHNVWTHYIPNRQPTVSFLDENLDQIYRAEQKLSHLFTFFAALGIFIACLGLLGLATLSTQRRTKEIGVRKVLGASVPNIVLLLSTSFAKLVALANLIAWPIAYYALWHWLQNYVYRIDLGLKFFILSGLLTFLIAILTVGSQTLKAARANPADTLRSE